MTGTAIKWAAVAGSCIFSLAACANLLSPEQAADMTAVWEQQLADGFLTQSQFDTLVAGLSSAQASDFDWGEFGELAITVGLGALTAFTGVTIHRGTPGNRKGLPPAAK
jgi:hypothetical protein